MKRKGLVLHAARLETEELPEYYETMDDLVIADWIPVDDSVISFRSSYERSQYLEDY